jgi:hypothetical protein
MICEDPNESKSYLAGKDRFLVNDIEVYKLEPRINYEII